MSYKKKKEKYDYAILGNKGNGRTTLYSTLEKNSRMNDKEIKMYPEVLTQEMNIARLWSVAQDVETIILVFSAEKGLTPEIREYALLSKQLGFEKIVVYINKADLVDNENLEVMKKEVRDIIINDYQYEEENVEIISGSAFGTSYDNPFDSCVKKDNKIWKLIKNEREN